MSEPRRPASWRGSDLALAAVTAILLTSEVLGNGDMTPALPLLAVSFGLAAALPWRQAWPGTVATWVCSMVLVAGVLATGPYAPQLMILPLVVVLFGAASRVRGAAGWRTGAATLALTVLGSAATPENDLGDFWPWLLWSIAWTGGTVARRRGDLAASHAKRAAELSVEARFAREDSARVERDRIARELHDVVGHAVSLMVVQAGAERLRLGGGAPETTATLAAIEETGRSALAELRTMLGVMREAGNPSPAPLPRLGDVEGLVARLRETGTPAHLVLDQAVVERVGAGAGLAAYRIVQEALTNAVKYAAGAAVQVEVAEEGGHLVVTVVNDLAGSPIPASEIGSGRGLIGMHERVAALGGSLEHGSTATGGFRVHARLPLTPQVVRA